MLKRIIIGILVLAAAVFLWLFIGSDRFGAGTTSQEEAQNVSAQNEEEFKVVYAKKAIVSSITVALQDIGREMRTWGGKHKESYIGFSADESSLKKTDKIIENLKNTTHLDIEYIIGVSKSSYVIRLHDKKLEEMYCMDVSHMQALYLVPIPFDQDVFANKSMDCDGMTLK